MEHPSRKALRLAEYNYCECGVYFITICTEGKKKLLCEIKPQQAVGEAPVVELSHLGRTVQEMIEKIPGIDKYVIMPNHVHMLIKNENGKSIPDVIRLFKVNVARKTRLSIWQRSYYDHIIRDESDYLTKWKYIDDNPAKWATEDEYYVP